eukprot:6057785-Prymnesium_polylepis.1
MRTGANGTRGGHGGGGCGVGGGPMELNRASLDSQGSEADWLAPGERRARALPVFERKDPGGGAIEAAGAGEQQREMSETMAAESAASEGQADGQAQAVASEPQEQLAEVQMEMPMEMQRER